MRKTILLAIAALAIFTSCTNNPNHPLISGDLEKLADGFKFTEGPTADFDGNVFFTDIGNNRIHVWTTEGKLELFRDKSGAANGLYFDRHGNLLICEGENRRVTSASPTGENRILTDQFEGKRYHRPNDLWAHPGGGIYFTDPAYGKEGSDLEMDVEGVYYILPDRGRVIRVCDDLKRPNGIIGTRDGKKLYITDHHGEMTWEYSIQPDGNLTRKKEFAEVGCDGLTMDEQKNLYLTNIKNQSVDIYSPEGELLVSIPMPEPPRNLTFGGVDYSSLFITAGESLYVLKMAVKGQ